MQCKDGWEKTKRSSLIDPTITEVAYIHAHGEGAPFVVVADHTGTMFRGDSPKFTKENGGLLDDFAWVLSDAMREYIKLKRTRLILPNA